MYLLQVKKKVNETISMKVHSKQSVGAFLAADCQLALSQVQPAKADVCADDWNKKESKTAKANRMECPICKQRALQCLPVPVS